MTGVTVRSSPRTSVLDRRIRSSASDGADGADLRMSELPVRRSPSRFRVDCVVPGTLYRYCAARCSIPSRIHQHHAGVPAAVRSRLAIHLLHGDATESHFGAAGATEDAVQHIHLDRLDSLILLHKILWRPDRHRPSSQRWAVADLSTTRPNQVGALVHGDHAGTDTATNQG